MGLEIERKFLVEGEGFKTAAEKTRIRQGFLNNDPERLVRVRISEETAWLTIKGPLKGITRAEFDYVIPKDEAEELLLLCIAPLLIKVRYTATYNDQRWDVDVFEGDNAGLVIAEAELPDTGYDLQLPDWVGQEVTQDLRYYNINLLTNPYSMWIDK